MLNKNNIRELAYVTIVDAIEPIPGRDRVECAKVGGWTCMVPKGAFKAGDPGIYFEIDSQVPLDNPVFAFCAKYKGHIKTQKFKTPNGQFWSQGLLMAAADFGWTVDRIDEVFITDDKMVRHIPGTESAFLTQQLGITYYEEEDNKRKAKVNPDAKINAALNRHPHIAKKWGKIIKKNKALRWIFLFFFGRKKDVRSWPNHIASKTDVERIQNMMYILQDKQPYVATEKIDGSSCSIMAEKTKLGKIKYYICSRNVVFEDENQKCYYDENIYYEVYNKYNLKEKITQILNDYNLPNVALQMEVFGPNIQKRDYSLNEHQAMIFHIVSQGVKMPMDTVVEICEKYNLPHVPIIDDNFIFPNTIEELQTYVEGEGSKIDGKPREGIVFYDKATGQQYTKFVSPEFLIKFHS
jgi:hypothetical protein